MDNVIRSAEPVVARLLEGDDDEDFLFAELGKRVSALARSPAGSDQFDMAAEIGFEAFGPIDELKSLGRKFFTRWNKAAYELVCGSSPDDANARKKVRDAFGLGEQAVGATIAGLLVVHFGLAAGVAGVVAVLIVRLFFRPSGEAMCDYWKEKL